MSSRLNVLIGLGLAVFENLKSTLREIGDEFPGPYRKPSRGRTLRRVSVEKTGSAWGSDFAPGFGGS